MNYIDVSLFCFINNLAIHFSCLNPIFIFFAKYFVYFILFYFIFFWLLNKERFFLFKSTIIFIICELFGKFFSFFIHHPQPFVTLNNTIKLIDKEINNSFPSDHTIFAFSICYAMFLKTRKIYFLLIGSIVGLSRIWVGVHYPSDVLFSIIISIFVTNYLFKNKFLSIFVKKFLDKYTKLENKIKTKVKL